MSSKKGGMVQFALIGAAVVVVVVGALLLFGGGGKKTASAKPKKSPTGEVAVGRKAHTSPRSVAHSAKSGRDAERAKRREERLKQKQDAQAGGSRTSRSSSGGYSQGSTSRGSSADPTQLRAILTDGTGSRFALVGERRFKSGDDIEGHRILEVTGDGVKMEYRQNTYNVKVGQKVY
jgi:hypothetical protein